MSTAPMQTTPETSPQWHRYPDARSCAEALAEEVAEALRKGVEARGQASLIVSGGGTPKPFFAALKTHELPWDRITVTLADERWIEVTDEDSNEKLIRDHLLTGGMNILSLKNDAPTPEAGQGLCEEALRALPRPYDVVILGMGGDGHTASLFPHHPQLEAGLNPAGEALCLPVDDSPKPPPQRMTLTWPALTDCRHLILHITGKDKRAVAEEAQRPGPVDALPMRAFLTQSRTPVAIYWAP